MNDYQGPWEPGPTSPYGWPCRANQHPPEEPWQTDYERNGLVSQFVSPTKKCWCGGSVGTRSPGDSEGLGCLLNVTHIWDGLQDQLGLDLLLWGNAYTVDGKRVDPTTVVMHRRTPNGESEQVHPKIHSQEEFLTALDVLLDHTLHADECYTEPNDTACVCAIGKVRAAMPPCGAVRPRPFEDQRLTQPRKYWTCTRNAHPASPDRHVFG